MTTSGQFPLRSGDRRWRIGVINGSNMSNLINRDPMRKGPPQTIQQLERWIGETGTSLGLDVVSIHSNHDGVILERLHDQAFAGRLDGILINPAGFTDYGEPIRHALSESCVPYVEVHFANVGVPGRHSVFTSSAIGVCYGFWKHSYAAGLLAIASILDDESFPKPARHYAVAD